MATQTQNFKKLKNGRKIVMNSVKNIHNGVLETAETLIEESIDSGVKYQKLAIKAIKKSEPILDKQVDIFFDTAEALVGQLQSGNKRLQKLLGITKTVKKAKSSINKTVKTAANTFEKNFEVASKTLKNVAGRVEDNMEKIGSTIKDSAQVAETKATKTVAKAKRAVNSELKSAKTTAKKVTRKAPARKKAVAKKVTTVKATAKKAPARRTRKTTATKK